MDEDGTFEPPTLLIYRLDPVPLGGGPGRHHRGRTRHATVASSSRHQPLEPGQPWPDAAAQPGASAALGDGAPHATASREWHSPRTVRPAPGTGSARGRARRQRARPRRRGGPGLVLLPVDRWQPGHLPFGAGRARRAVRARRCGRRAPARSRSPRPPTRTGADPRRTPCCWAPGRRPSARRRSSATTWSTGVESIVASGVVVLGISPDGTRLAVVDESDRASLEVVDVATGDRRTDRRARRPDDPRRLVGA